MPKLLPYKHDLHYSYALGIYPCHTLLDARPAQARRLLISSEAREGDGVRSLMERCEALGIRMETADNLLHRISGKKNCYAAIVFDKYASQLQPGVSHVLLHNPSDSGNLGTILRTCLGFGIRDIAMILPAADEFNPHTIRASMGAMFQMNIARFDQYDTYRAQFGAHAQYPLMSDGRQSLAQAAKAPKMPYTLIFGNESTGLPPAFVDIGQPVRIVHNAQIDSLNLAVAVAIAVYAFTQENCTIHDDVKLQD